MYIEIKDLSYYRQNEALFEHLNLEIYKKQTVALTGQFSSVLLKLIGGREIAHGGYIAVDNFINIVPQKMVFLSKDYPLIKTKTVIENLLVPLRLQCVEKATAMQRVEDTLIDFGLYDYRDFYPEWLNENLIALTAFAEATLFDWELYLLDKPFYRMNEQTKRFCYQKLKLLKKSGKTIVFTTESSYESSVLADTFFAIEGRQFSAATTK